MGKPQVEWSYGDVDKGFKDAALVLDETFSMANNYHQTLETRSALAYWRNGKLYMHTGTQSAVQTVAVDSQAGCVWIPSDVVLDHGLHRWRVWQQGDRCRDVHDSGPARKEGQRPGADADY